MKKLASQKPSSQKLSSQIVLLSLIFILVFFSGCINLFGSTTTSYYKNDVITLEDYVVTETSPIPGSSTTIKFTIRNNGDREVPKAIVNFFDTKGFQTDVECKNGNKLNEHACEYTNIPSLDERGFAITFKIPELKELRGSMSFNFNYMISYDYQGSRRITIPIIDDEKIKQPLTKFQTGQPSIGPIAADFDPPVGRTTKSGNQVVKEYWGVKNSPFEIKVNFKQVGSTAVGTVTPTNITAGKASLKLTGMTVDSERTCDFSGTSGTISSKSDVTVPATLICFFRASFTSVCPPTCEKTVAIDALFSYTYSIQRSEAITISTERLANSQTSQTG